MFYFRVNSVSDNQASKMDDGTAEEALRLWTLAQQGLVQEIERAQCETPCPPNGRWPDDALCKALYVAAWNDEAAVLQALLREPNACGMVAHCNDVPMSLLQCAARRGSTAAAQVLLGANADVDYCGLPYRYDRPVVEAAAAGQAAMVQLLVDAGADLVGRTLGLTPLCVAANNGHADVLQVLLSAKVHADACTNTTALCCSIERGHLAAVQVLVLAGANVNAVDTLGITLLERAVALGRTDLVHLLLAAKADVDAESTGGWTPIANAAVRGHLSAVKLLASAKADLERANRFGLTPIFHAAERNNADMVEYLMSAGADPRRPDNVGQTPLSIARVLGHEAVVRLLQ